MGEVLRFLGLRNSSKAPMVKDAAQESVEIGIVMEARSMPSSGPIRTKRERELRLQAVQLASMLPDDPAEAKKVMEYVQRIVNDFIERERNFTLVKRE
jgi:hypothetical protein